MLSRYNVSNPLLPVWGIQSGSAASLQHMMNRLFENIETAFGDAPVDSVRRIYHQGHGRARAQVRDTGDAIAMIVDLPGLRQEDIELSIEDGVVNLKAARRAAPAVPEGFTPVRRERALAALDWSFALPYAVDTSAATATFEQGRLEVSLPKAPEAKPRSIPVRAVESRAVESRAVESRAVENTAPEFKAAE